jgi:hypothetical protein
VIVLDNQGVVIASDSRKLWLAGQRITYADGVEKVIPLGTKLAFMSSGITEVSVATSTIRPAQLVRICYASFVRNSSLFSMKELAGFFAKRTTDHLNRLSDSEKAAVALLAQRFGSQNGQVIESMIAGIDIDGTLKVETIDFYLPSLALGEKGVRRFDWTVDEALATDRPRVILSGEVEVVKSAFQGGESPIRRSPPLGQWVQAMLDGRPINAVQTAKTLVDLTIRYSSDKTRLGYPIVVYRIDAQHGFKKVVSVQEQKTRIPIEKIENSRGGGVCREFCL